MKTDRPDARVAARYLLFQLPGTAAVVGLLWLAGLWVDLPLWVSAAIVGVWVVKEIVLFPFVWRAYDARQGAEAHLMVGMRGVAEQAIDPRGYVRLRGELWQAEVVEGEERIEAGAEVEVVEVEGPPVKVREVR